MRAHAVRGVTIRLVRSHDRCDVDAVEFATMEEHSTAGAANVLAYIGSPTALLWARLHCNRAAVGRVGPTMTMTTLAELGTGGIGQTGLLLGLHPGCLNKRAPFQAGRNISFDNLAGLLPAKDYWLGVAWPERVRRAFAYYFDIFCKCLSDPP